MNIHTRGPEMRKMRPFVGIGRHRLVILLVLLAGVAAVMSQQRAQGGEAETQETQQADKAPAALQLDQPRDRDEPAKASAESSPEKKPTEASLQPLKAPTSGADTNAGAELWEPYRLRWLARKQREIAQQLERRGRKEAASKAWDAAIAAEKKEIALLEQLCPPNHRQRWLVVEAKWHLRHIGELRALDADQRRELSKAEQMSNQVTRLFHEGKHSEAIPLAQEVLDIRKSIFGQQHLFYANDLNNLAMLYGKTDQPLRAEPLYRQALEIKERVLGKEDPSYAVTLANQAGLYHSLNQYGRAEPLLREVVDLRRRSLGKGNAAYATSLNNLAMLYYETGDYARAKPLLVEAVEIDRRALKEEHPEYATALSNLGTVCRRSGDQIQAETLLSTALDIRKRTLGQDHADYMRTLKELLGLYRDMGKDDRAEPLLREALDIRKRTLGEEHPKYLRALIDFAGFYRDIKQYGKAEPLLLEAQEIVKRSRGESDRNYGTILHNLAVLYEDMGEVARSEAFYRHALEIRKDDVREKHTSYAATLFNLAQLYETTGQYTRAEPLYRQASDIWKKELGPNDPQYATCLNDLGILYSEMGQHARAESFLRQALDIRTRVLGEQHDDRATSLNSLGLLYLDMGDYEQAEPLVQEALAIRKRLHGENPCHYATTLNNLALCYQSKGDYARAERLYRQAMETFKKTVGEDHKDYATSLSNLAWLYREMGNYAQAELFSRKALDIRKRTQGVVHRDYADSLMGLAHVYTAMGDYARAVPLYEQALAIYKLVPGKQHPVYATCLGGLGSVYLSMGDYTRAAPYVQHALAIRKTALGEKHPSYAASLNSLALLYMRQADYSRAIAILEKSLEIQGATAGESSAEYAVGLDNLGVAYSAVGDNDSAVRVLRQSLDISKRLLGDENPRCASSSYDLAIVYYSMGKPAQAEPLLRQALEISERLLQLTAAVQSERQELAMNGLFRDYLDAYLAVAPAANVGAADIYGHVLRWKGAVLARQRQMRMMAGSPELKGLFEQLQSTTSRLATLATAPPDLAVLISASRREARRRELAALTDERQRLEKELALHSAEFSREKQLHDITPDQLRACLGDGTALVDFVVYAHTELPPDGKGLPPWHQRLAAFVIRADSPIIRVDLGPAAKVTEAVEAWRMRYVPHETPFDWTSVGKTQPANDRDDAEEPGRLLRRLTWEPLQPHLRDARLVLVSPDGALGRFPLAALPGTSPDKYLIEEVALAVVPAPQLLPDLLPSANGGKRSASSLLAMGNVDYAAEPAVPAELAGKGTPDTTSSTRRKAARGGKRVQFGPHPGIWPEIQGVRDIFQRTFDDGQVLLLQRAEASEESFRQLAPRHRYVHVNTHGFFAAPELKSVWDLRERRWAAGRLQVPTEAIVGLHPGLLSGIALAGADRFPAGPDRDDGILTALEVAALDLSGVELVVLSSCSTGLGAQVSGEGLLGLQRACQAAGARAVVASLWEVRVGETRELMHRFYENLWQKGMPKAEALRQAQLAMLRRDAVGEDGARAPTRPGTAPPTRAPPSSWAAWVLSGDWR